MMKKHSRRLREAEVREEVTSYLFLSPYLVLFAVFIVVPVIMAILLSFTNFDSMNFPSFVGLKNYITLLTTDNTFMQYVLPNTIKFSLIVGPVGYFMSFIMAWAISAGEYGQKQGMPLSQRSLLNLPSSAVISFLSFLK